MKKTYRVMTWILSGMLLAGVLTGCGSSDFPEENLPSGEEEILPEGPAFSVRFLDVGQADAALVSCDGEYMLIDGGHKGDSDKIYTILRDAGIDHLKIIVGTHLDSDHIGGLAGALSFATAEKVLSPVLESDSEEFQDFLAYAELNGGGMSVPEAGDTYALGSAVVTVLGLNSGEASNDKSIILKISYGDTTFLFMGDGEAETEQILLNSGVDLSADVLKVAHHGSADSTSQPFLDAVDPESAVISVGENTYSHPTKVVLERLDEAGAAIYRTDLQGEILAVSDGKNVQISCQRDADRAEILTSGTEQYENDRFFIPDVENITSDGGSYAVNRKNGKIHIVGKCPATGNGQGAMSSPQYFSTYEEAYAYAVTRTEEVSKINCGNCWKADREEKP